jgi:hypothetical protein
MANISITGMSVNPYTGRSESGYVAGAGLRNGDTYYISNALAGSNTPTKKIFAKSLFNSVSVGATIPNTSDWIFTEASHNPVGYLDSVRGKVAKNDYFAQADIGATHSAVFGAPVGYDTDIYISRWVRYVVTTTGDVAYPVDTEALQLKTTRLNVAYTVVDTADNSGTELVFFRWWNGTNSLRVETGDGKLDSTATAGSSTTITDSTKSFGVNTLKGRGLQLTSGTGAGQFSLITSNTATVITPQYSFSPSPTAGTGYNIDSATRYLGAGDLDVNAGWQKEEIIIRTNSANTANGTCLRRVWKADGSHDVFTASDMTYYLGAGRWNYNHFQNYFGNNSVAMLTREVYTDSSVVMIGAPNNKRVILCDTPDMASNSLVIEDQPFVTWSSGDISGPVSTGNITASGIYYLLVVEGDSDVLVMEPQEILI